MQNDNVQTRNTTRAAPGLASLRDQAQFRGRNRLPEFAINHRVLRKEGGGNYSQIQESAKNKLKSIFHFACQSAPQRTACQKFR